MEDLQALVDAADSAALLRAVDGLSASRDWDRLADLARRCRDAVELGKQLWPVAMHIDYRLALEAPADHAAAVLVPGAARFALGPLTEVAASTHDWASLAPHLDDAVSAAAVATERVLRGEDLRDAGPARLLTAVELPLQLCDWEPAYALPTYRDRDAQFPQPAVPEATATPAPVPHGERLSADEAVAALLGLAEVWTAQSAGDTASAAVAGTAIDAVGVLTERAAIVDLTFGEALALMQWAAASGGAYGRRPGGAAGRFAAWWAVAALTGLDWPDEQADAAFGVELGRAARELRWYRWSVPAADPGWVLRLAVADPVDGLAWALAATDRRADPDELDQAEAVRP